VVNLRTVGFKVSDEVYDELAKIAKERGTSISALVKDIVLNWLGKPEVNQKVNLRVNQELTEKVNQLVNQLSEINNRLNTLESRMAALESSLNIIKTGNTAPEKAQQKKHRATIRDIIKDRKVELMSDIMPKNPEAFISKAKSEGIVVLEGGKDVALVDPEAWEEFKSKWMRRIPYQITDHKEMSRLPEWVRKLAIFLYTEAMIYYDKEKGGWQLLE